MKRGYAGHIGKGVNMWNHGELQPVTEVQSDWKLRHVSQFISMISAAPTCSWSTVSSREIQMLKEAIRAQSISLLRYWSVFASALRRFFLESLFAHRLVNTPGVRSVKRLQHACIPGPPSPIRPLALSIKKFLKKTSGASRRRWTSLEAMSGVEPVSSEGYV